VGAPPADPGSVPTTPFRIFINYRRSDSGGYAGRIYDALNAHADSWKVFMDIDTIDPGEDFTEVIDRSLETCDVVIAVIGRQWLQITDARGRRRLEHPDDFVRLELLAALDRTVRVIPALVQGAEMPSSEDLPDEMTKLARRNAFELSDARWHYDIGRLVEVLEGIHHRRAADAQAEDERQRQEDEDRLKHELAEREAAALATAERERAELDRAEREQAERELDAREQAERDEAARKQAEREEAARRQELARLQAAQERAEREQAERDKAARKQAEREEAARQKELARLQAAQERAEREAAKHAPRAVEPAAGPRPDREVPRVAVGRGAALLGSALFLAGIWAWSWVYAGYYHESYWTDGDGVPMLIVGLPMVVSAGASLIVRRRIFDLVTAALGLVALGIGALGPLLDYVSTRGPGVYLAVVGPLLVIGGAGAAVRGSASPAVARRASPLVTAVTALGVILFFAAIWLKVFAASYSPKFWTIGQQHRLGIFMVVLALVGAASLVTTHFTAHSLPKLALLAAGLLALGITLDPALGGAYTAGTAPDLKGGAALAFVAPGLIAAGALGVLAQLEPRRSSIVSRLLMLAGLVLFLASIWLPAIGDESYWRGYLEGHRQAVFMLILAILSAAAIGLSLLTARRDVVVAAGALGLVGVGFDLYQLVNSRLGWGIVVALVGAILFAVGAILLATNTASLADRLPVGDAPIDVGDAASLLGVALLLAALGVPAGSRYWPTTGVGFILLLLVPYALLLLGRFLMRRRVYAIAGLAIGLVLFGFALYPVVVTKAHPGTGKWLAAVGATLLVAGAARVSTRHLLSHDTPPEPSSAAVA
jgi:hypothetical protein